MYQYEALETTACSVLHASETRPGVGKDSLQKPPHMVEAIGHQALHARIMDQRLEPSAFEALSRFQS